MENRKCEIIMTGEGEYVMIGKLLDLKQYTRMGDALANTGKQTGAYICLGGSYSEGGTNRIALVFYNAITNTIRELPKCVLAENIPGNNTFMKLFFEKLELIKNGMEDDYMGDGDTIEVDINNCVITAFQDVHLAMDCFKLVVNREEYYIIDAIGDIYHKE